MRAPLAALALLTLALPASAQQGGAIAGRWLTDDGNAVIEVAPCSAGRAALCGRIARLVRPATTGAVDRNNPDRALRTRPLVGVQVLSNLTGDGGRWTGRGYSPEEGRNFNATVRVENGRLNVRGCVAVFCRTVVWSRAS